MSSPFQGKEGHEQSIPFFHLFFLWRGSSQMGGAV